jgi:transcriptional regulator with XRE-family HTH domain
VDLLRLGRAVRVLRIQRGYRQADVAIAAGVARSQVARIEQGDSRSMSLGVVERVAASLGGDVEVRVRWRGEALDRLLDAAHAALVEPFVRLLRRHGWEVAVEVSFNLGGERGSIDVLAFHQGTHMLLVVEVKSVMPDAQALLAGIDRKARLAARIARERGWIARDVGRLVVIGDSSTTRRRVALLDQTFSASLPHRGHAVRAWLRAPAGGLAGLLFLPYDRAAGRRTVAAARQRVRRTDGSPRSPK